MATYTVTTPDAQDARVSAAIGAALSKRNATQAEIEQWLFDKLESEVLNQDRQRAAAALLPPPRIRT